MAQQSETPPTGQLVSYGWQSAAAVKQYTTNHTLAWQDLLGFHIDNHWPGPCGLTRLWGWADDSLCRVLPDADQYLVTKLLLGPNAKPSSDHGSPQSITVHYESFEALRWGNNEGRLDHTAYDSLPNDLPTRFRVYEVAGNQPIQFLSIDVPRPSLAQE